MVKFCPNLYFMYQEHDFLDRFEAARRDGFEYVEICFAYDAGLEAVEQALRDTGQKIVSFNFPAGELILGKKRGVTGLPGYEKEFDAQIEEGLEWAAVLDISMGIAPLAGIPNADADYADCRRVYAETMKRATLKLEKAGVTALVEPNNSVEHTGYLIDRMAHAAEAVRRINHPNVRILFDTFHTQMMEGRIVERFMEHRDLIAHVQVGNVPGRHEPDDGEVDHGFFFNRLDESGYHGWVAGEYFPREGTSEGLSFIKRWGLNTTP